MMLYRIKWIVLFIFFLVLGETSTLSARPIHEMTKNAEAVILGHVEKIKCYYNEGRLITMAEIRVIETWKGNQKVKRIQVLKPGGVLGEISQIAKQDRRFRRGSQVVLFLEGTFEKSWVISSFWHGHFDIRKNSSQGLEASNNRFSTTTKHGHTMALSVLKEMVIEEVGRP